MNQARYYIRVGIALVVAGVLLVIGWGLLRGTLTNFRTIGFNVEFEDARGITEGASVLMAGVAIGQVERVTLTPEQTARLRLRIDNRFPIPRGSRFVISNSLLGNAPLLRVEPARRAGGGVIAENEPNLSGVGAPGLDDALNGSGKLLQSVQATVETVERLLNDPTAQRDLQIILRNVRIASETLPTLSRTVLGEVSTLSAQTNRLLADLQKTSAGGNRVVQNAGALTSDLRGTLAENRGSLRSLIENADGTASAIRGLTEQLNEALQGGGVQQNLSATTDSLRSITARLDTITGNFERLSSDPRLSSDVRETVANLKETSSSVRSLAARIEAIRLPGERRPAPEGGGTPPRPRMSLLEPGPVVDTRYDLSAERLRVDANYTLLGSQGRFYRAGLYDVGERNRLNLQVGRISPALGGAAVRYGLVAGRLGAGLDFRAGPIDLRVDLFDPNRLTLDARAKARLDDTTSLLAGVDSLGNGNRAVLGVQIRR